MIMIIDEKWWSNREKAWVAEKNISDWDKKCNLVWHIPSWHYMLKKMQEKYIDIDIYIITGHGDWVLNEFSSF